MVEQLKHWSAMAKLTDYKESVLSADQLDEIAEYIGALQQKLDAMAAENASMMALAIACEKEFGSYTAEEFPDDVKVSFPEDKCHITFGMIRNALNKTATDAYLNSVRAEGVEMLAAKITKSVSDEGKPESHHAYAYIAMNFADKLRSGTHDTADKAG